MLLTADQRLQYQQNVKQFAIGVVVVETVDTTIENLRLMLTDIRDAIDRVAVGEVVIVRDLSPRERGEA